MFFNLRKKGNKLLPILLQIFAMGCLFVAIFDKEAVFIFKDFVDRLQLGADIEMTLIRLLLPFRMIAHCPSFYALLLIITPIVYLASNKQIFGFFEITPFKCKYCDVQEKEYEIENFCEQKNSSYLKTMRLLFWDNLFVVHVLDELGHSGLFCIYQKIMLS